MTVNVGTADRSLRILVGLAVLVLGFYFKSWWGLVGLVPVLTAALKWCPLYSILGLRTCPYRPSETAGKS